MEKSFREVWDEIDRPEDADKANQREVRGTNARVFKESDGSLGLLISDLKNRPDPPMFENLKIEFRPEKILREAGSPDRRIRNCIEVRLDPSCDSDMLATILGRMHEKEESGQFSSDLLFGIIDEVVEIVRRPPRPPSKDEVVGAWGEMFLLRRLLSDCETVEGRERVLSGWESSGPGRDIIDFRFPFASGGTAIEMKTSSSGRSHHINGVAQVTVPERFSKGFLGSLLIVETDGSSGETANGMMEDMLSLDDGSERGSREFRDLLRSKISVRGAECLDERFYFSVREGGLRLIPVSLVPKPAIVTGVTEVEWVADVSGCLEMEEVEVDLILASISS